MSLLQELGNPARYRRQLDRLHARLGASPRLYALRQRDVPLARLVLDKDRTAALLARDVAAGAYRLSPAAVKTAHLDKPRELFSLSATDLVVHGVVAELITEAMEPRLSPRLYSYRRGRSPWHAARDFAAYVRQYRAAEPVVTRRGLYVLRCDVAAYGDSIPLADGSPIWSQLGRVLGAGPRHPLWPLLQGVVRPEVHNAEKPARCPCVGVATGSPVATALANLYLDPLDHRLGAVRGGFYARYGDDLLFAHPDAEATRAAAGALRETLAGRGLRLNEDKSRVLYMNGAGRPAPGWPGARGTTAVTYLGCRIDFAGTVGLPAPKCRAVLRDVRARLGRTSALFGGTPPDERTRALCAVVNAALDPRSELAAPHADLLARAVTDRRQLKQLDYWIARAVVRCVTGSGSARGFRRLPYRRLRRDFGLVSLVVQRNRPRRERRS